MSVPHLIVIAVIALLVLGPEKLPQVARTLGKLMAEFRRITGDFRSTVENEMRELEREASLKELRAKFPDHVHYDVQQRNKEEEEAAVNAIAAVSTTPPPPAEFTGAEPAKAETTSADVAAEASESKAAAASGNPIHGEPNPA